MRCFHFRRHGVVARTASSMLLVACPALAMCAPGSAAAQSTTTPNTPPPTAIQARSISELIQALPGRFVPLSRLIEVALDVGLDVRMASAERRVVEADAWAGGRVLDPLLQMGTGITANGLTDNRRLQTAQAALSGALPWGTALSAELTRGSGSDVTGTPLFSQQNVYGLFVTQPLLEGRNQRDTEWRAARIERTAAIQTFARSRERVSAEIEVLYWTLAELQASEAVFQRSLELAQTLLTRNSELASRDLVADVDVLTSRSGVALRQSNLIQARQARRDASDRVLFAAYGDRAAEQLAQDSLPIKTADDRDMDQPAVDLTTALRSALSQRRDLRAAESLRDASRLRVDQARNALLPGLALDAGWSSTPRSGIGLPGSAMAAATRNSAWRVGLSVSAPLFNFGDRGASLRATALFDMQDLRVRAAMNDVRLEVREAVRAVQAVGERLQAAEQAASLAWDQLQAERRRLELGLGDSFRLLQTEENAVRAQLEAVRARYELARAQVRFRYAVGSRGND